MKYEFIKQAYLKECAEFSLATEAQVDKLSDWLDANDYHNAAHQRWDEYQEEMRYMLAEL